MTAYEKAFSTARYMIRTGIMQAETLAAFAALFGQGGADYRYLASLVSDSQAYQTGGRNASFSPIH